MQLSIEKLVYGGDGLARLPADEAGRGKAAFLPFVLEAEKVEATVLEHKRGFARARADQILEPSPHRVEAACPYFRRCGGCHYQHADYQHQLQIKAAILKENLRRIAKIELEADLIAHPSPPWNYRNRARLQVQSHPEFALGYYRYASHTPLPVEQCPISSHLINCGIAALWEVGRAGKMGQTIHAIEFFADAEDEKLLLQLDCAPQISRDDAKKLAEELLQTLPSAAGVLALQSAENQEASAQLLTGAGATELIYKTQLHGYRVSGGAFFQVNRYLIDKLVEIVTDGRSGALALGLYAGVGLFSRILAGSFAQVIAVEASPTAFADLSYNSTSNTQAWSTPRPMSFCGAARVSCALNWSWLIRRAGDWGKRWFAVWQIWKYSRLCTCLAIRRRFLAISPALSPRDFASARPTWWASFPRLTTWRASSS